MVRETAIIIPEMYLKRLAHFTAERNFLLSGNMAVKQAKKGCYTNSWHCPERTSVYAHYHLAVSAAHWLHGIKYMIDGN